MQYDEQQINFQITCTQDMQQYIDKLLYSKNRKKLLQQQSTSFQHFTSNQFNEILDMLLMKSYEEEFSFILFTHLSKFVNIEESNVSYFKFVNSYYFKEKLLIQVFNQLQNNYYIKQQAKANKIPIQKQIFNIFKNNIVIDQNIKYYHLFQVILTLFYNNIPDTLQINVQDLLQHLFENCFKQDQFLFISFINRNLSLLENIQLICNEAITSWLVQTLQLSMFDQLKQDTVSYKLIYQKYKLLNIFLKYNLVTLEYTQKQNLIQKYNNQNDLKLKFVLLQVIINQVIQQNNQINNLIQQKQCNVTILSTQLNQFLNLETIQNTQRIAQFAHILTYNQNNILSKSELVEFLQTVQNMYQQQIDLYRIIHMIQSNNINIKKINDTYSQFIKLYIELHNEISESLIELSLIINTNSTQEIKQLCRTLYVIEQLNTILIKQDIQLKNFTKLLNANIMDLSEYNQQQIYFNAYSIINKSILINISDNSLLITYINKIFQSLSNYQVDEQIIVRLIELTTNSKIITQNIQQLNAITILLDKIKLNNKALFLRIIALTVSNNITFIYNYYEKYIQNQLDLLLQNPQQISQTFQNSNKCDYQQSGCDEFTVVTNTDLIQQQILLQIYSVIQLQPESDENQQIFSKVNQFLNDFVRQVNIQHANIQQQLILMQFVKFLTMQFQNKTNLIYMCENNIIDIVQLYKSLTDFFLVQFSDVRYIFNNLLKNILPILTGQSLKQIIDKLISIFQSNNSQQRQIAQLQLSIILLDKFSQCIIQLYSDFKFINDTQVKYGILKCVQYSANHFSYKQILMCQKLIIFSLKECEITFRQVGLKICQQIVSNEIFLIDNGKQILKQYNFNTISKLFINMLNFIHVNFLDDLFIEDVCIFLRLCCQNSFINRFLIKYIELGLVSTSQQVRNTYEKYYQCVQDNLNQYFLYQSSYCDFVDITRTSQSITECNNIKDICSKQSVNLQQIIKSELDI